MKAAEKISKWQKKIVSYKFGFIGLLIILLIIIAIYMYAKPKTEIVDAGNQVLDLSNRVRDFYKNKPNAWGLNTYSAIQNKIVPQDMLNGRQIINQLKKDVLLGSDALGNTVMPGSRTFAIVYKNLNFEECKALATFDFSEKMLLSIDNITIINDKDYLFSWGESKSLPVSAEAAQNACKQENDILWNIYI